MTQCDNLALRLVSFVVVVVVVVVRKVGWIRVLIPTHDHTMGQNRKKHRMNSHLIITFPRARE